MMTTEQINSRSCRVARRTQVWRAIALMATLSLQACGGAALSPLAKLSAAATVAGSVSQGSLMGGSTLGALRNAMTEDDTALAIAEPNTRLPADKPVGAAVAAATPVNVAKQSAQPQFRDGLERACYFPNARAHSLPCT